MRRQVDVGSEASWSGRVDFLDVALPLVVEVDSERYHASLTDASADLVRHKRLEAAGFTVVRFGETDIWRRPTSVVDRVHRARVALAAEQRDLTSQMGHERSASAPPEASGVHPPRGSKAA